MNRDVPAMKPPRKRYDGPISLANDSTVETLVYLPTPYSIRHIGIDQSTRNRNQTMRNTSAPSILVKSR